MLRSGGDVWAGLIELNEARFRRKGPPIFSYRDLCAEVAGVGVGELSVTALRSVVRRYSDACFETARRKKNGEPARYPRRRRALVPLRYYFGTFTLEGLLLSQEDATTATVPIQMIVTVEARHGKEVPVLKPGDAMVFQKKERLRVTSLVPSQGEHAALELYILVDDASGISLGPQLNDLRQFIQAQPATTSIGVGYMRNGTVQMTQDLTPDHAKAAKGVRLPLGFPGASPSPFLSLSDLIQRWRPSPARHEVLMVTSGIDALGGEIQIPTWTRLSNMPSGPESSCMRFIRPPPVTKVTVIGG